MSEYDASVPDESEQLDQLQPDETLVDRGIEDVLDEGYVTPENWSAAEGYGNTADEMRHRGSVSRRLKEEEPERQADDGEWNPEHESRQVGGRRAGRLVDVNGGYPGRDHESYGYDVGIDGGAACAEEAAMHIIDDSEDVDDDDA